MLPIKEWQAQPALRRRELESGRFFCVPNSLAPFTIRCMNWNTFRTEFPVTRRWAYFDHAAVAPLSGRAQQALLDWTADMTENGDVHESNWLKRVEEVRRSFGRLLNADPLDIAFVKNTSDGIGIVAEGLPW